MRLLSHLLAGQERLAVAVGMADAVDVADPLADGCVRAKSLDAFCPMGPWLATADDIPDPGDLRVRCRVNGSLRQDASTADLLHGVAELIAHCSRSFTLQPGDIITTGTAAGVGAFWNPPTFLADGDMVEVEIDRIGVLRNDCRVVA